MLTIITLFTSLISTNPETNPETTLKMEGPAGVKIFGFCISTEGPEEKKFEGVTPTEVRFDTTIRSCKLSTEGEASGLKVRVFQNRTFVTQKELHAPSAGVEIAIPLGKKKK